MLVYIPFDLEVKIMEKLPPKSLIRFKSVSKTWRSSIDNSQFISDYTIRNTTRPHNLLLSYIHDDVKRYVCFVDDDNFPDEKFTPIVPPIANDSIIIGSSHGLICFQGYIDRYMFVIWNPSIRKSIFIHITPELKRWSTVVGFGVISNNLDPKIVKIFNDYRKQELETQVEVFELSSGIWRVSCSNAPPRKSIAFLDDHVSIGQFIYWKAVDVLVHKTLIVSFDMNTEEFKEIHLPNHLTKCRMNEFDLTLSNLNESLVVIVRSISVIDVWMMEDDDSKLFNKLYTIIAPEGLKIKNFQGFRKCGEPIIQMQEDGQQPKPYVFEPCSRRFKDLEIVGRPNWFVVNSYTESLLLLNQKDNTTFSA